MLFKSDRRPQTKVMKERTRKRMDRPPLKWATMSNSRLELTQDAPSAESLEAIRMLNPGWFKALLVLSFGALGPSAAVSCVVVVVVVVVAVVDTGVVVDMFWVVQLNVVVVKAGSVEVQE